MTGNSFTGATNIAAHWPAFAAIADGAVADNSRGVHGQVTVVSPHANRDDLDLTGHRPTELTPAEAA